MNLNAEQRFSEIPNVEKPRSIFDRSFTHKTSYDSARLIPVAVDEVLPGDTWQIDFSHVTRMTTPIAPVMDNCWLDVFAFFVPTRLLWIHWKEFWGENNTTYWEQPTKYVTPKLNFYGGYGMTNGVKAGSLINYLGFPVGYKETEQRNSKYTSLPLRGYVKIWNDWFRDENLKQPLIEFTNDSSTQVSMAGYSSINYNQQVASGAYPMLVSKAHDYFTSALPAPLKSSEVSIFGGEGLMPVNAYTPASYQTPVPENSAGLTWRNSDGTLPKEGQHVRLLAQNKDSAVPKAMSTVSGATETIPDTSRFLQPSNLWADMSYAAVNTISQLRTAFAIQRFYEALARGGSRYCEFLSNIWGVQNQDARLQRSEFLGARRFPINVDQVLQTSQTATTPQGTTAAFSCTVDSDDLCTYSSSEHGYIYVMAVVRHEHSYCQGINKMWGRNSWEDYYVPQFAHLSEMTIKNYEIYAQGTDEDDEVFGYQEAWAEYRYKPNMVTGKMAPNQDGSLAIWNYCDKYDTLPTLSSEWINETDTEIKRTLAVQTEPQFISDFYINCKVTRVMPLYSVPGLLDHF